jgi:hypothetical protein
VSGTFTFTAEQSAGSTTRRVSMTLLNVTGTGQFSLTLPGHFAVYDEITGGTALNWVCNITQGSGSITFTTLTATRAVGMFSFTAPFNPVGSATGTKTVTGTFDITVTNPQ